MVSCILIVSIHSAEAASKPYRCQDHYSQAYCIKTGQIPNPTPVQAPTNTTSVPEPIKLVTKTNSTTINLSGIKRDDMDTVDSAIRELQKEIESLKTNLFEIDRNLQTSEWGVKLANDEQDKAKLNHKMRPSEPTRLELEAAIKKLDEATKLHDDNKKTREDILFKLDEANRKLGELKPKLKEIALTKKNGKVGVQTVGIMLSNTCIAMLKNNLTTNCPSYETLMSFNWDTSKSQSGSFVFKNGYYHRDTPLVKNDYKLYSLNDYNIIMDPSPSMIQHIKTITISQNLESYLLPSDLVKVNNTRTIHKDRYVDSCTHGIISADTWQQTLSDTIQYLRGGCTTTLLGVVDAKQDETTIQDISTSSKYKHDQWIKEIKETHKQLMIGKDNSTNRSTIEDEG